MKIIDILDKESCMPIAGEKKNINLYFPKTVTCNLWMMNMEYATYMPMLGQWIEPIDDQKAN